MPARRLTRFEYDASVRDLLGLPEGYSASATYGFTADGFRSGFNNNALGLTVAALDVENYLRAAKGLAEAALSGVTSRAHLVRCELDAEGAACVEQTLESLAGRAFRRPVTAERRGFREVVAGAASDGASFEEQLQVGIAAILMSPDFLFRIEPPAPDGRERALDGYELSTRLSYFLWGTTPDDALLAAATSGSLENDARLAAEIDRLLGSPRVAALATQLAEQWMQTLALQDVVRDGDEWERFDTALAATMAREVEFLMRDVVTGQRPVTALLTDQRGYLNRDLADWYGIPGVSGDELRLVDLSDERGGVLRSAAFLVANAAPEATSPVRRGKWVLEQLLCSPPPPPPANVPSFELETGAQAAGSQRDQLEAFFAQRPECAACHQLMNPIGYAFEHYDTQGHWRDTDDGFEIDASGQLPGSDARFDGVEELARVIQEDERFARCVAEKLFAYALGRDLQRSDRGVIAEAGARLRSSSHDLPSVLRTIAESPLMRFRAADTAELTAGESP